MEHCPGLGMGAFSQIYITNCTNTWSLYNTRNISTNINIPITYLSAISVCNVALSSIRTSAGVNIFSDFGKFKLHWPIEYEWYFLLDENTCRHRCTHTHTHTHTHALTYTHTVFIRDRNK